MAARTQKNACKKVRSGVKTLGRYGKLKAAWGCRTPKPRGRSGPQKNAPASWRAAVLCRFTSRYDGADSFNHTDSEGWIGLIKLVVLVSFLFLPGCTTTTNQHAAKPPEKVASPPPAASTNAVMAPKPEPVTAAAPVQLDLEAERNSLLEADLSFSRRSEEKGAAQAFYEFLAPDAVTLSAGEPPMRGREAIKVHLAAGPQGFFTWQPIAADVSGSGDVGYTWGTANFQTKGPDDKPRIVYSKYVTVWRKQNSGRWKVVLFSTSPSPPPTERRR